MSNWSKLTVAKLKDECAERDISITGLKLKQHYIDKLAEWEAAQPKGAKEVEEQENGELNGDAEAAQQETAVPLDEDRVEKDGTNPANGQMDELSVAEAGTKDDAEDQKAPIKEHVNDSPPPQEPESQANEIADAFAPADLKEQKEGDELAVQDEDKMSDVEEYVQLAPESVPEPAPEFRSEPTSAVPEQQVSSSDAIEGHVQVDEQKSAAETPASTSVPPLATQNSTRSSSIVPPAEVSEDARKRKRRSVTPPPQAEEIALKKAKANDGSPLIHANMQAEKEQAAIDKAGVDADAGPLAHEQATTDIHWVDEHQASSDHLREVRSASPINERTVAPALHAATSTLYIRNFKRPVRQPDLQAHIASLARSSRDDLDFNPIKFFYLDVLRTHAFVRLHSISAASRVRSAVHETRWPDEPTRDLLWADFIPDHKAEKWANEEADANTGNDFGGSGFRSRGGGKKWEVIYPDGPDGVEAVLRDANEAKMASAPRQPSFAQGRKPSAAWERELPPGVHPDRAALVSSNGAQDSSRAYDDFQPTPRQPKNAEKSFAALDELFSSTEKTKPKLYYKPVALQVVDERMELIKDLRVGHNGRGRSGDEGMKRYTFEWERGRQEWADKGPEFGFGKKGRDRMDGQRGRGGGGYRGRGGGSAYPPRRPGGDDGPRYQDWDAPPPPRRGGGSWRGGY